MTLVRIASDESGWQTLYYDEASGLFYEKAHHDSEAHGAGEPALTQISAEAAHAKYKFEVQENGIPKFKTSAFTANLGAEYDETLKAAILKTLRKLGARRKGAWWGLGGSTEIEHTEFVVKGHVITVERETYIGLEVSGDEKIVLQIQRLVEAEMSKG